MPVTKEDIKLFASLNLTLSQIFQFLVVDKGIKIYSVAKALNPIQSATDSVCLFCVMSIEMYRFGIRLFLACEA